MFSPLPQEVKKFDVLQLDQRKHKLYCAYCSRTNQIVIYKMACDDPSAILIANEIEILTSLPKHPNIIPCLGHDRADYPRAHLALCQSRQFNQGVEKKWDYVEAKAVLAKGHCSWYSALASQ